MAAPGEPERRSRRRRELGRFALALAAVVAAFLHESLFLGRVLSPADVLFVQSSFPGKGPDYEPANRLLMDPVLQFEPWLDFNRAELRAGRLPLWNPYAGAGAPHLANGQSAVFDPVHLLAYLGPMPAARAWMAALRLWLAGMGMFLLARAWGLGRAGRWFAGLSFPLCGFLVVWLQYPVTPSAVWLPWVLLAAERVIGRPTRRGVVALAAAVAASVLAGHVQTTAHVLILASACAVWRLAREKRSGRPWVAPGSAWGTGIALGLALAAVQVVPLADYLRRSPVWADRQHERPDPLRIAPPRLLDAACTVVPYLYGSQRRGQPNVARAIGVHNLNESAGGFAGTPTALLLAPLGVLAWRSRRRARLLVVVLAVALGLAFQMPPLTNVVALVPVLDVMDHRRATLVVACALAMLGGLGIDRLAWLGRGPGGRRWVAALGVVAVLFALAAGAVVVVGPRLADRAAALEREARPVGAGHVGRHVANALRFYPTYFALLAVEVAGLAIVCGLVARGRLRPRRAAVVLTALTLIDLFAFGFGMNPAIDARDARPSSPVVDRLRQLAPFPARTLALDAELVPNTLMRYSLADIRNYDSVELLASVEGLASLYEPDPGRASRTSRREVTWAGVERSLDRLVAAGVRAIVSTSRPPAALAARAERVGDVWIVSLGGPNLGYRHLAPGQIAIDDPAGSGHRVLVPVSRDPGWAAEVDGTAAAVEEAPGGFLSVPVPAGTRRLVLTYRPRAVVVGGLTSLAAGSGAVLLIASGAARRRGREKGVEGLEARSGGN